MTPQGLAITISIGIASFGDDNDNEEILIGNADRNLYQAKHEGRNRIVGEYDPVTSAGITGIETKVS